MSADSKCETFQARVQKLRSLREKLCDQKSEWKEAFEIRDFVISELQDIHSQLDKDGPTVTVGWCKERIECILKRMCALSIEENPGEDDA